MSEVVMEGIFVLGAALVGGLLGIFGSRSGASVAELKRENQNKRRQVERLLKQVESYHLLEDLYASTLASEDSNRAVKTIKTEYRNKVVEQHQCVRPHMTANEAKKHLQEIT